MKNHDKFIKSHIEQILEEVISACELCGNGMEAYPLSEYILSSVFLKMTGYGEQKLKCILWEMATVDYNFRYDYISGKEKFSECSNYSDKNRVLKNLIKGIQNAEKNVNINAIKGTLVKDSHEYCKEIFADSIFREWRSKEYDSFIKFDLHKADKQFFVNCNNDPCIFQKNQDLFNIYESLYRQRNRLAHNTISYQENLPAFKVLERIEHEIYYNYFLWFYEMVLIDRLFIRTYELYGATRNSVY